MRESSCLKLCTCKSIIVLMLWARLKFLHIKADNDADASVCSSLNNDPGELNIGSTSP